MKPTHYYCPKCKSYFSESSSGCGHGYYSHRHDSGEIRTYGLIPYFIKGNQVTPLKYKKFLKLKRTDPLYSKINGGIKHSQNQHFLGTDYFIARVGKKEYVDIDAYRVDYPYDYSGPSGVKKATLYIYMHKRNDLISCDGILNLYSKKLPDISECTIYEAMWVVASRTLYTDYEIQSGFIAKSGNTYYHSKVSADHAVAGVQRKIATAKEIKADLKKSKERLGRATRSFYESIPEDMVITRADAIAAGNCVPGVDNWLRRFSLDPSTAYNARGMLSLDPSNQFLKKTILYKMAKLDKKPSIIKKNYLNMIKRIGAV